MFIPKKINTKTQVESKLIEAIDKQVSHEEEVRALKNGIYKLILNSHYKNKINEEQKAGLIKIIHKLIEILPK